MRHEPRSDVHLWPTLAAALDGGTAGLASWTALALARVAARAGQSRGRRLGAAVLAWMVAALAFERLLSVALLLSHPPAGTEDLPFASALRLSAGAAVLAGTAVLTWLVARRRR